MALLACAAFVIWPRLMNSANAGAEPNLFDDISKDPAFAGLLHIDEFNLEKQSLSDDISQLEHQFSATRVYQNHLPEYSSWPGERLQIRIQQSETELSRDYFLNPEHN
jgi:hypothetical protein